MKQLLSVIVFFIAACQVLFAQDGKKKEPLTQNIKGVLVDEDSKKPLANATVALLNTGSKTISDSVGNFSFSQVSVGRQALEITLIGYENKQL